MEGTSARLFQCSCRSYDGFLIDARSGWWVGPDRIGKSYLYQALFGELYDGFIKTS